MKSKLIFILILFFIGQLHSQENVHVGLCKFEFSNFEKINPTFSSIDIKVKSVSDRINDYLKIQVDTMFQQISFVKGQELKAGSQYFLLNFRKYYDKRKNDKENYFYNLPKYEFLFKLNLSQIGAVYYFNIQTDSTGSIIGECLLPNIRNTGYPIITKERAVNLVQDRWKTTREIFHVKFAYHTKKKCFVWTLTKPLEHVKKGYLISIQYIVLNAHNGKVIEDKMENIATE
jgi:hypothetical protein